MALDRVDTKIIAKYLNFTIELSQSPKVIENSLKIGQN
jgi:hypothetical protein